MTFGVLDFIDSNGVDETECPMLQTISDDVFDGVADLIPGSPKGFGGFLPGKLARPASQKQHISFGQLMFAIAPGNLLDQDATATTAVDPPHAVEKENKKAPQRNKLETPLG